MKKNILEMIGNTPIVKINNMIKNAENVYMKLEGNNPGGSVKDRAVLGMVNDAEEKGLLKKGSIIVEPTSGNTGIAIAMIGKIKGYKVIIVMPDTMSVERRDIIKSYGAELILTDGSLGMKGSIDKAHELQEQNQNYFILEQFSNPSNWRYHYNTTAEEIIESIPDIDIFIAGVGTGGTISGVGKKLKEYNKNIKVIAIEPSTSAVITGNKPGPHKIQGIGAGFIPKNYLSEYIDEVITVSTEEAFSTTKELLTNEGLFVGLSTGANMAGTIKALEKYGIYKKVVIISPDTGHKYMSTNVYK